MDRRTRAGVVTARAHHQPTGRWQLGLLLALIAMLAWAALPIILSLALEHLDPWTLTWFRFAVAGVLTGWWVRRRGALRLPGAGRRLGSMDPAKL